MSYDRADIVIVPFPFFTLDRQKLEKARPALVLSDMAIDRRYNDLILAAITSRVPAILKETEVLIEPTKENGLAKRSCIRLEFLMTVPFRLISRKIGKLTPGELTDVDKKLVKSIGLRVS